MLREHLQQDGKDTLNGEDAILGWRVAAEVVDQLSMRDLIGDCIWLLPPYPFPISDRMSRPNRSAELCATQSTRWRQQPRSRPHTDAETQSRHAGAIGY